MSVDTIYNETKSLAQNLRVQIMNNMIKARFEKLLDASSKSAEIIRSINNLLGIDKVSYSMFKRPIPALKPSTLDISPSNVVAPSIIAQWSGSLIPTYYNNKQYNTIPAPEITQEIGDYSTALARAGNTFNKTGVAFFEPIKEGQEPAYVESVRDFSKIYYFPDLVEPFPVDCVGVALTGDKPLLKWIEWEGQGFRVPDVYFYPQYAVGDVWSFVFYLQPTGGTGYDVISITAIFNPTVYVAVFEGGEVGGLVDKYKLKYMCVFEISYSGDSVYAQSDNIYLQIGNDIILPPNLRSGLLYAVGQDVNLNIAVDIIGEIDIFITPEELPDWIGGGGGGEEW